MSHKGGRTALHDTVGYGSIELARRLLHHGADANCQDKDDRTPLHCSVLGDESKKHIKGMVALLVKNGANIMILNGNGRQACWLARGKPEIQKFLNDEEDQRANMGVKHTSVPISTEHSDAPQENIFAGFHANFIFFMTIAQCAKVGFMPADWKLDARLELLGKGATDIFHGDIKPQNVLIYEEAESLCAKLSDFNFSCFGKSEEDLVRFPKSKPWYAPEYVSGEIKFREAKLKDIYSYELLCFWTLYPDEFYNSIREADALRVGGRRVSIQDEAKRIARATLALKPSIKQQLQGVFDITLSQTPERRLQQSLDKTLKLLGSDLQVSCSPKLQEIPDL
ncbi:hypothetical protein BFJ66_g10847 [Fusarium oxysporum f. sp. cepae]|nr:hypothetical protein BFJ66_g10847 [Fusarium oxysporum f. sp. cepae]